ncbi:GntR family transcriptional regulator [uncultured Jatrophihabitans sp.]|uniref:GntR family transcriptional regulator n=1 Tax=uncultured Jatrophihabitans sp. TaxID=1610747 RepID=UPI0035CA57FC
MLWTIDHASRIPLQEQIAACIRRAIADAQLSVGDRLPPAQELADAVAVDRNTVLAAYRSLREAGLLEFRRGRGVRVADSPAGRAELDTASRELVRLARRHGYGRAELITMIEELT